MEPNLVQKLLYKVLYKDCSFRADPSTNMAAMGNSCFWLADMEKIFSLWNRLPNELILDRKPLYKVLYKVCSFRPNPSTNMAAMGNSCFWLADMEENASPSETARPNELILDRKPLYKVLYKDSSFRADLSTNMAATGNSCFWLADMEKKSFSSETYMAKWNWNFTGSIYIRSFIKFPHFVPFRQQTWLPQAILVSDWLIWKRSSHLKPLCQMN